MSTRATYTEDDWVAEVEVLDDLGDREREAYRLRVVRTVRRPVGPNFRPVPDGHTFLCDQARDPRQQVFALAPEAHGFPELPREAPCLLGLAPTALDRED